MLYDLVMDRDEQIAASIRRVTKLKTEAIGRESVMVVSRAVAAGGSRSSRLVLGVEEVCAAGYRAMSTAAAVQIAEIEGEDTPKHADRLGEVLREAQAGVMSVFNDRAGSAGYPDILAKRREALQQTMGETLQGTVDDLRLGIAGGVNVKKQKAGVSIDNRGGSGQFIVDSAGASQTIGRDQTTTSGIDVAELTSLLGQVRDAVGKADLSTEARDNSEDAIVSVEREISEPVPNVGRVRRLLGAVGTIARDTGVNIAAALIAGKLQQMGI